VSSKKVLIMPSPAESSSEGVPRESTSASFHRGSEGDLQLQIGYLLAEIRESLGELRNAAKVSDDARKISDERILQLIERTAKAETILTAVNQTVDRHSMDLKKLETGHTAELNELGSRHTKGLNELGIRIGKEIGDLKNEEIGDLKSFVHTAKILGYITLTLAGVIATAIVTYFFRK
jgi:hypothetical protein